MIQALRNLFTGSRRNQTPRRHARPLVRGRYDAAQHSDNSKRHWAMADGHSARSANAPDVRRRLRNRSRYEIANNSYAKGMVYTLANDVVGTGPRLQMLGLSTEDSRLIENEFLAWADAIFLTEKLHTMRVARAQDGEAFGMLTTNPVLSSRVTLDLRLVEAEQVATPDLLFTDENRAIDGIRFDQWGNPSEYHVLNQHPGARVLHDLGYARLPAESIIHDFRVERPGQARGVPEITPALPLFALLREFAIATLDSAKAAASFAGILYTDAPANGEADDIEPMDAIELQRNLLLTMPGGWKFGQVHAEHPITSYSDYVACLLNEAARAFLMPYNIAVGNSSGFNYASGRLDNQGYHKVLRVDQRRIEQRILNRLFVAWVREAILIEGYLPQRLRLMSTNWAHQWFWDGPEHVDPAKEANAQATRLASNTTTLADEYAKRGQDWETQLRQIAKERELMNELGLTPSDAQPGEKPKQAEEEEPARAE